MSTPPFDKTAEVEATITLAFFLITAGLCLHEGSRKIRKACLTAYDVLLYFAYVDVLAKDIIALWLVKKGACSDVAYLNQNHHEKILFDNVFFALAGLRAATTVSVKLAVLFLYKQVFTLDNRRFRIAWCACFLYLVPCFLTIDLTFYGIIFANKRRTPHVRLADFQFGKIAHVVVAWLNTIADMSILTLPLPYLLKLRVQRSQKAALGVLLCMGFLATAGTWANAILLSVALAKGRDMSQAYSSTVLLIASVAECAVGVLCACLATSKPAVSVLWSWLKAVSRGAETHREFTELPQRADNPETRPGVKVLSVEEMVQMRSRPAG
ncbi:hypothetical protein P171DRAFT_287302 [Karstenula rhodostoma CBS 690.94]|uniref:Rhodopsin domain-containing protein n=1 Tax=Karstenula rhodostoma CBS 690.94 TaxID=1392251 RepID=A0A9P4PJ85_9PLEO|nr:hypothetical protein P171DRAFT_287302 [Karstenula rhodostoma CBS 690.94]